MDLVQVMICIIVDFPGVPEWRPFDDVSVELRAGQGRVLYLSSCTETTCYRRSESGVTWSSRSNSCRKPLADRVIVLGLLCEVPFQYRNKLILAFIVHVDFIIFSFESRILIQTFRHEIHDGVIKIRESESNRTTFLAGNRL